MEMKKVCFYVGGVALAMTLVACGNNNEKAATPAPAAQGQVTQQASPGGGTATAPAPAAPSATNGKVLEMAVPPPGMDASGYTYVKLQTVDGKEIWAAGPKTDLQVGETVALQGGSVMQNFSSKTLERTFDEIIFASGFLRGDGAQTVSTPAGASSGASFTEAVQSAGADAAQGGASSGSSGAVVPFADLKVPKAEGANAYTVGEVFTKSAELDTKKVLVKGQVVKMSRNIMGKNWIHLQDGTGDPNSSTHDLVVTTAGEAEKGAIVTVDGVVAANKDFGSGYRYNVIIEDATVTQ